jgi:hypothetical protein
MPTITSRLREPIIIFQLSGDCSSHEIQSLFRERLEFLEETGYPMLYSITDTTYLNVPDTRLVEFLHIAGEKRPGTARDNRIVPVLCGSGSRAVQLYRQIAAKPGYRGVIVPVFDTLDLAIKFARWQILIRGSER